MSYLSWWTISHLNTVHTTHKPPSVNLCAIYLFPRSTLCCTSWQFRCFMYFLSFMSWVSEMLWKWPRLSKRKACFCGTNGFSQWYLFTNTPFSLKTSVAHCGFILAGSPPLTHRFTEIKENYGVCPAQGWQIDSVSRNISKWWIGGSFQKHCIGKDSQAMPGVMSNICHRGGDRVGQCSCYWFAIPDCLTL